MRSNHNIKLQQGFTLVELAIVLVIIGLIIGAIVTGNDLIKAARRRSVVAEVTDFSTALRVFYGKYNALPGDMTNATTYLSGTSNGNGNQLIDQFLQPPYTELWQVYKQLSGAGLISGTYTGAAGTDNQRQCIPGSNMLGSKAYKNKIGYTYVNWPSYEESGTDFVDEIMPTIAGNVLLIGAVRYVGGGGTTTPTETWGPGFDAADAFAIDSKIDDGLPAIGRIVVPFAGFVDWSECTTTLVNIDARYKTTSSVPGCSLLYKNP